ncbi:hypothetical protein N3K66_006612 [Trichothecium roseum]|uniref:Uncharacterized protein n=1 Tax=Trichothecium roseum TaxID=47278 RepID=A0ACC0UVU3_9HYPO|nr:hypothetical protein N3K66_006612 [Trichothecium roseum]
MVPPPTVAPTAAQLEQGLPESRVLILGTGGTICMQHGPDGLQPSDNFLKEAMAPRLSFNDMSSPQVSLPVMQKGKKLSLPSLRTPATAYHRHIRYTVLEFDPLLDSSSMSAADWVAMALAVKENYHLYDGFVVLHGTDSLAHTASALSFIMENLGKPVVLTGSQAPIFALQSDAVDNLLGSLVIAGTFCIPEVGLFFHHKLYRGNRTTKVSATSFDGFASPNLEPLAKVNGLGIDVDWSLVLRPTRIEGFDVATDLDTTHVACLRVFPGIKAEMLEAVLRLPTLRGLVLETFGMGNVPGGADGPLTTVIRKAIAERGVIVINVSQCVSGFVSPVYAPATHLSRAGVTFGLDLTVEAALTKLSYLLARPNLSRSDITDQLSRSIRGEMTEISRPTFSHPSESLDAAASRLTPAESAFAALGYAIREGDVRSVCDLVTGQGEQLLKQADYAGNTAVHLAAASGNTAIMRELLQRGASVHERNMANNSPLFLATLNGQTECAQLLRATGAHLSVEEVERGPWSKSASQPAPDAHRPSKLTVAQLKSK